MGIFAYGQFLMRIKFSLSNTKTGNSFGSQVSVAYIYLLPQSKISSFNRASFILAIILIIMFKMFCLLLKTVIGIEDIYQIKNCPVTKSLVTKSQLDQAPTDQAPGRDSATFYN